MNFIIHDRSKNVTINDKKIVINGIKDKEIKITGTKDVVNYRHADALRVLFIDDNGNEFKLFMTVAITKEINNKILYIPARLFYADINMYINYYNEKKELIYRPKTCDEWYRFKNSFIIQENEQLIISPRFTSIETDCNKISKEKSRFALDATIRVIEKVI